MTSADPTVRLATAADRAAISLTLARAFHDDPLKMFLTGGQQLSVERSLPFFDAFQQIQLPHGHIYLTHNAEAAALWAPPGHWKVPFTTVVRHAPTFLRLYGTRFLANLQVLTDLERLHPHEPHYYLEFIGTDPAHRGRGFAASLMLPMVQRADAEGVGMYLESSKEENLAFYGRFGFTVRAEMDHRRNGPHQWLMWRDPR